MEIAGLDRRFAALLVDWLLCLLAAGWFGPLNGSPWPWVVLVGEYTVFIGAFGQTPGMWLTRVRCVRFGGGGRLGVPRAALRAVLLGLVIPALLMDANRRGLHDRLAGSVMVAAVPTLNPPG
jgi:uncharacterized RDD family membrane protein YckC